ncbi:hypothetical protein EJB05_14579, partial [Eragrostis curvula]
MDDQLMEQVDSEISVAPAENQGEMSMITQKSSRGYVPWNDEMDKVLLDTFVKYFNKGDQCQNGWKPHVYTAAVKNVREKCNVNITKSNIDSRSKTFDKHKLKMDSDSVWDDYVERNKDAKGYMDKVVKFWDLLSVVYNKDQSNGPKLPPSAEVLAALQEIEGLDEDTELDLYDILTSDARKFE